MAHLALSLAQRPLPGSRRSRRPATQKGVSRCALGPASCYCFFDLKYTYLMAPSLAWAMKPQELNIGLALLALLPELWFCGAGDLVPGRGRLALEAEVFFRSPRCGIQRDAVSSSRLALELFQGKRAECRDCYLTPQKGTH